MTSLPPIKPVPKIKSNPLTKIVLTYSNDPMYILKEDIAAIVPVEGKCSILLKSGEHLSIRDITVGEVCRQLYGDYDE